MICQVSRAELPIVIDRARAQHVAVRTVEAAADRAGTLQAFARGLTLPSWFGHNLDALTDSLRDLADDTRARILIVWDGSIVRGSDPVTFDAIREILETVHDERDDLDVAVVTR